MGIVHALCSDCADTGLILCIRFETITAFTKKRSTAKICIDTTIVWATTRIFVFCFFGTQTNKRQKKMNILIVKNENHSTIKLPPGNPEPSILVEVVSCLTSVNKNHKILYLRYILGRVNEKYTHLWLKHTEENN